MKRTGVIVGLVMAASAAMSAAFAQDDARRDSTGLPGDNFSLEGALEMFKKAPSPEEFEKLLNEPDNHVNNLDLNGDGDVDYIRVVGSMKGDAHVFVLQVPIAEKESQDIAVIELEKTGNENAVLQIVGDGDIFGEMTIVEPDGGGKDDEEEEVESDDSPRGPHAGLAPAASAPMGAGKPAAEIVIPTVRATVPHKAVGINASSCSAMSISNHF